MSAWRTIRAAAGLGAAVLLFTLLALPRPAAADHSLGRNCYDCHKLSSATVWQGTKAIDTSKAIGQAAYGNALYCDFCHTGIADEFDSPTLGSVANETNHPVYIIDGTSYSIWGKDTGDADYNWQPAANYGDVKLLCADCHGGDTVTGPVGPLSPDLAPEHYTDTSGNTAADGYPTHDLSAFNGSLSAFSPVWDLDVTGDDPHATTGLGSYVHAAAADSGEATTRYALCFSCHDGSAATSHQEDVESAYTTGAGHFFSSDGARIGCMDCHDSHGSESIRLYNRGVVTTDDGRAICLDCHDGSSRDFTDTTAGVSRNVTVPSPPTSGPGAVAAHGGGASDDCTICHNPHDPSGGRDLCFDCHSDSTTQAFKDALGAGYDKYVDDGSGDDFGFVLGNDGRHDITFVTGAGGSDDCLDCHALTSGNHADGNTYNDLADPDSDGVDWPVSTANPDAEDSPGALVGFCIDCHDGDAQTWFNGSLTAPNVNDFIDFGPDGNSGGGDDVTNNYGEGDTTVTGYTSNAPTMYDTATGSGHDPPGGYQGVPMFAHYSQGDTSGGTAWWQLGSTSAPQPFPCLNCHFAHGAANDVLYRSPVPSTGVGAEKYTTPRDMCLDCHNGTDGIEGRTAPDPTSGPLDDRYGSTVPAHDGASGVSCTSSSPAGQCHNVHSPSCEVCHGYPP